MTEPRAEERLLDAIRSARHRRARAVARERTAHRISRMTDSFDIEFNRHHSDETRRLAIQGQ
jgi:hypothetical protein